MKNLVSEYLDKVTAVRSAHIFPAGAQTVRTLSAATAGQFF